VKDVEKQNETAEVPVPELMSRGTYAIYGTPKGGLVVSYRVEGATEDGHLEVPAPMVSMARRMAAGEGGMGTGLVARMMGMRQA
jgi:hypothetical protein